MFDSNLVQNDFFYRYEGSSVLLPYDKKLTLLGDVSLGVQGHCHAEVISHEQQAILRLFLLFFFLVKLKCVKFLYGSYEIPARPRNTKSKYLPSTVRQVTYIYRFFLNIEMMKPRRKQILT